MSIFSWVDSKIKQYRWFDISLIKLSVFSFSLLIAKFYPAILSLDWYFYLIIVVLAAIRPFYVVFNDN